MKTKPQSHTPGPWDWELDIPHGSADGTYQIFNPARDNKDVLAIVDPNDTRAELGQSSLANARLIAAAPELLTACERVEEAWTGNGDMSTAVDQVLLAIAKAVQS